MWLVTELDDAARRFAWAPGAGSRVLCGALRARRRGMREFSTAVEIEASADRAWGAMRDVEKWAEWTPTVKSVRIVGGGALRVGARAWIKQPKFPPAMWRVTELNDAARRFTWVSWAPGLRVTARHRVEARGEGSRAILSIRYDGVFGGVFARMTREINESYLALEAKGLKGRSEGRV